MKLIIPNQLKRYSNFPIHCKFMWLCSALPHSKGKRSPKGILYIGKSFVPNWGPNINRRYLSDYWEDVQPYVWGKAVRISFAKLSLNLWVFSYFSKCFHHHWGRYFLVHDTHKNRLLLISVTAWQAPHGIPQ